MGCLPDDHPTRRGDRLETGSRVDDIPNDALPLAASAHHRFAGVDPDAHGEVETLVLFVELVNGGLDSQTYPDRPLRVILVGGRHPEDGHDAIADQLLDGAVVALNLFAYSPVVRHQAGPDVFRVGLVGFCGESHQVSEQNGEEPSLLGCGGGEGGAAIGAEDGVFHVLFPARWAVRHGKTLRQEPSLRRCMHRRVSPTAVGETIQQWRWGESNRLRARSGQQE